MTTLSVLHYVYGGFICLSGFAVLAVVFAGGLLQSDWLVERTSDPAARWAGQAMMALGWALFALVQTFGVMNLVSANLISNRRGSTFSQVVAAFNCLSIPFGLLLGIFTFVVLNSDDVRREYGRA